MIVPQSAEERQSQGEVLAVGPGRYNADGKLIPVGVQAGQTVLLPEFGGQKVGETDENMVLLDSAAILAVLEK